MKERGTVTDTDALQLLYKTSQESTVSKAAKERQAKIVDANYFKIEINEHVESLDCFNAEQKSELLQALKSYPTLFGGGLGKLNIEPIRLELKEGANAYETTTRKEIERVQKKLEPGSELATPNGAPARSSNRRKRAISSSVLSTLVFSLGFRTSTTISVVSRLLISLFELIRTRFARTAKLVSISLL